MKSRIALIVLLLVSTASPLLIANRNFVPDWTSTGSSLTAFRTVGHAQWKAGNGEIVGTPTSPEGGWLVLDKNLQDVQFAANVRCTADCIAGVMLRAEQSPTGMKGVFVPFGQTDTAAFAVAMDKDGREVTREPLGRAGGMVRVAGAAAAGGRAGGPGAAGAGAPGGAAGAVPPPGARGGADAPGARGSGDAAATPGAGRGGAAAGGPRGAGGGGGRGPAGLPENAPYTRPTYTYKPGEWN